MPEESSDTVSETEAAAPPEGEEELDLDRAKAKIAKANNEARNLRSRLKELEPLAARARETEEAQKSESQRLSEQLDAARAEASTAAAELMRYQIAAEKGLPPKLARFLVGSTQEEIEEAASALLEAIPAGEKSPPRAPAETAKLVANGTGADTSVDAEQWFRSLARNR